MVVSSHRAPRWITMTMATLLAGILIFVAYEYSGVRWFPASDHALTEMRVRSVWSAHPPLIGLPGRIGAFPDYGSHPGPISFFALWPMYRLLGSSSWALQVSTLLLHLSALIAALLLVHRRGRTGLVVGFTAAMIVLISFYGPLILSEPWNPHLPIFMWVAFMVAVWAMMCGDPLGAPIGVAAGSFCAATHISYAGLIPGLALVGVGVLILRVRRRQIVWTRQLTASVGIAVGLGLVLWLPPLIEQLIRSPGNIAIIVKHFSHPVEPPIGFREGGSLLIGHLNPWNLITRTNVATGPLLPGLLLFVAWTASVAVAVRRRMTELVLLQVVIGSSLLLGAISMSRIFGLVHNYLMQWSYTVLALMLVAIGWAIADLVPRSSGVGRIALVVAGAVGLAAVAYTTTGFVDDARSRPLPGAVEQRALTDLAPRTQRALERRARQTGVTERYMLDWVDPVRLGDIGFALLDELQREGFRVGASPTHRRFVPHQYQTAVRDADSLLHVAVGSDIDRWRAAPGAVEIATADPRTPAQKIAFESARQRGVAALRDAGLEDLESSFLQAVYVSQFDDRLPAETRAAATVMSRLGDEVAVFVVPIPKPAPARG